MVFIELWRYIIDLIKPNESLKNIYLNLNFPPEFVIHIHKKRKKKKRKTKIAIKFFLH